MESAEEEEILSPLSVSWIVVEKKQECSPSYWKSGDDSSYVWVPSPHCEKVLKERPEIQSAQALESENEEDEMEDYPAPMSIGPPSVGPPSVGPPESIGDESIGAPESIGGPPSVSTVVWF